MQVPREAKWDKHEQRWMTKAERDNAEMKTALRGLILALHRPQACHECFETGQCGATDYVGSECGPFVFACAAIAKAEGKED